MKGFNLALEFDVKLLKKSGWVGATALPVVRNLCGSEVEVCQPINTGPAHPQLVSGSLVFSVGLC